MAGLARAPRSHGLERAARPGNRVVGPGRRALPGVTTHRLPDATWGTGTFPLTIAPAAARALLGDNRAADVFTLDQGVADLSAAVVRLVTTWARYKAASIPARSGRRAHHGILRPGFISSPSTTSVNSCNAVPFAFVLSLTRRCGEGSSLRADNAPGCWSLTPRSLSARCTSGTSGASIAGGRGGSSGCCC